MDKVALILGCISFCVGRCVWG